MSNGKNLDGWWWWPEGKADAPEPSWAVEGGIIRTTPDKGTPVYLISKASFTDFELSWDWRVEKKGNSGIKYRFQDLITTGKRPEPQGLEFQMADDEANPDAISQSSHSTAAIYSYFAPKKSKPAVAEKWHSSRIIAKGLHIEHWLDGVKVVSADLDKPATMEEFRKSDRKKPAEMYLKHDKRTSQIALQIHDGLAEFRNLKIRTL
jgi:hypothetical protein